MRRIFVGDIQGCCQQLEDLLGAVKFRTGVDVLYPVGDLVNKGPESDRVLTLLMELDARPVLGNHDVRWLQRGRIDDPAARDWLAAQPYVRVMPDIIMVHAGVHPAWNEEHLHNLTEEDKNFAVTVRYCDKRGNRPAEDWPIPGPPYRPWHEFYKGSRRVVFGHWARQGLFRTDRVLGLDTGCCYGNELTGWIAEEDRLVQVPGWRPGSGDFGPA